MKKLIAFCLILFSLSLFAQDQTTDREQIRNLMARQVVAWNNFDLEGFMDGYWRNDSLKFFGKSGITHGWEETLARYKKGYPDRSHTGKLRFKIESITPVESDSYYVMGRFYLTRDVGNAEGIFMLVFKRIDGQWKIVADTSC